MMPPVVKARDSRRVRSWRGRPGLNRRTLRPLGGGSLPISRQVGTRQAPGVRQGGETRRKEGMALAKCAIAPQGEGQWTVRAAVVRFLPEWTRSATNV